MSDKRQYLRWSIYLPVKYKIEGQDAEFSSQVKDISNGGICISDYLPRDINLDIKIGMPGDIGDIRVRGKSVWQEETGGKEGRHLFSGIKFLTLSYSDKDKIYNYLYRYKRSELLNNWWVSV